MTKREININETPLSVPIAEAISEQTSTEITDFTLYDAIEPESLDRLLREEKPNGSVDRISFTILGRLVVVECNGETVTVDVSRRGGNGSEIAGP